jgi:hypothetical protein
VAAAAPETAVRHHLLSSVTAMGLELDSSTEVSLEVRRDE